MFDTNADLGVVYNGYKTGTFLKVEKGQILDLTLFNGKSSGSLNFKFTYASAVKLGGLLTGAVAMALSLGS